VILLVKYPVPVEIFSPPPRRHGPPPELEKSPANDDVLKMGWMSPAKKMAKEKEERGEQGDVGLAW
jgi:hypothetical protein